ncbi:hypothetical protein GOODEAATRI_034635 [Goodea atripinnis]|uniref:Uncharacterized protein n=1 Tax=Goodea atripinnis TaxID=208336 RepID=A0ABV0MQ05_9TELE
MGGVRETEKKRPPPPRAGKKKVILVAKGLSLPVIRHGQQEKSLVLHMAAMLEICRSPQHQPLFLNCLSVSVSACVSHHVADLNLSRRVSYKDNINDEIFLRTPVWMSQTGSSCHRSVGSVAVM